MGYISYYVDEAGDGVLFGTQEQAENNFRFLGQS